MGHDKKAHLCTTGVIRGKEKENDTGKYLKR